MVDLNYSGEVMFSYIIDMQFPLLDHSPGWWKWPSTRKATYTAGPIGFTPDNDSQDFAEIVPSDKTNGS